MAKVLQKKLAGKKKNWIAIYGSENFENLMLGESLAENPNELMNRVIEVSLGDLSKDIKRQSVKLHFKVSSVKENRAVADLVKYNIMSSFLRRSASKVKNKMNDSFTCTTKDGVKLQIKPMLMTKSSSQKSKLSTIRTEARKLIVSDIANMGYNELVDNLINYRLQKSVRERIKKLAPLAVCDVRVMERLS